MTRSVRLDEVLSADLLEQHQEHIKDFLEQEGLTPHADGLGATVVLERQLKELLAELAHGQD